MLPASNSRPITALSAWDCLKAPSLSPSKGKREGSTNVHCTSPGLCVKPAVFTRGVSRLGNHLPGNIDLRLIYAKYTESRCLKDDTESSGTATEISLATHSAGNKLEEKTL
ncbi:hypothetical protein RRG08_041152 [Elysia crispata]|uniref:Uncharacterized protein n=1 Tax=Elysia crispata TaxID=231223 RepID=A0AAE0XY99_9GAST|nr:hypothetical protein RRG08_041152 [Elysia crispata]